LQTQTEVAQLKSLADSSLGETIAVAPPRRLTFDLDIERVRRIISDLDATLDPVKVARLHGGSTEVYRIDLEQYADPLVLKIYGDEKALTGGMRRLHHLLPEAFHGGWE
jgi:hypothetical protein